MLAEESVFASNSNTIPSNGGSIYFSSYPGECVQNRICGYKSCIPSNDTKGVFCYVDSSSTKIIDSSICNSGKDTFQGTGNLYLINGQQLIKSVNISYTNIYDYSLFFFYDWVTSSYACYSTFINNSHDQHLYNRGADYVLENNYGYDYPSNIKYCNFQRNKAKHLIWFVGDIFNVTDCSFQGNSGGLITYNVWTPKLYVERCYADVTIAQDYAITVQNSLQYYFTVELSHISTAECEAEFPKVFVDSRVFVYKCSVSGFTYSDLLSIMHKSYAIIWFNKKV